MPTTQISSEEYTDLQNALLVDRNNAAANIKFMELREELHKARITNEAFLQLIIQLLSQKARISELLEVIEKRGFDDIVLALNLIQDSYGRSPLHAALADQNFLAAKQLIDFGASIYSSERAAFSLACDSSAARSSGFSMPEEEQPLHIVKNFGLTLGIQMTSVDGTFSQLAHTGESYQLMAESVNKYTRDNFHDSKFRGISEAFNFSKDIGHFSYSTSQNNPRAGELMAERIHKGEITTIPSSCKGHAVGLSVVPDGKGSNSGYLVYTNRGLGTNPGEAGTKIYRIDDLKKVTPEFINSMMNGHSDGKSHDEIVGKISQVTDGKEPIHTISQKAQKRDNCTIANPRANIHGILLCQEAIAKGGFQQLNLQDLDKVKGEYKKFTHAMRVDKVNELADALEKDPKNPDLIKLSQSYLEQHPNAGADLRERLENTLNGETKEEEAPFVMKMVAPGS